MSGHYILDGHRVVEADLMTWANWVKANPVRHVADENVGYVRVSTIFLGLDHSFGSGPPLLFETAVFGGPLDQELDRYTTWEQAKIGHKNMAERVKEAGP